MNKENNTIKYFLYARKSSESEDKQMASIDSQIAELQKIAMAQGLQIVDTLSESRSAKAPGRPVFNDMMARIHKGEADGILCWKLNRLARNPIDGGQISWALQQSVVRHIQTFGRGYLPTDNVIVIAVELGMANQFIRDLSVDTKRGLRNKAERGWYPSGSTLGYMPNPHKKKGEKEIIEDEQRFPIIRKMFDLMLTGAYTPPQILDKANKDWGLKNRKNGKVARSTIYRMFGDPFYYGEYEYPKGSGLWIHGLHKAMITREEYDKVQILLGRKGNPRAKTYNFALRGPISCGECGAKITAESKVKRQKNGNVHFYTFYHCTKRKDPNCTQGSVEEKVLEKQITDILGQIEIPQEFHEWAMDIIKESNKDESAGREKIIKNQQKEYNDVTKKLDNLIHIRANGEISEEDHNRLRGPLLSEKLRLNQLINHVDERVDEWQELTDKSFSFAEKARFAFQNGTPDEKREILCALGSNPTLKDKKLSILLPETLIAIKSVAEEARTITKRFEPLINVEDKRRLRELYSQSPTMLPG